MSQAGERWGEWLGRWVAFMVLMPLCRHIYMYLCVCVLLQLELRACILSHSTSPFFVMGFFEIGSQTICLGWLQTVIFLICASLVARITGVSHWHQAGT
jgi:hypothetical protein